jgi:surface protein
MLFEATSFNQDLSGWDVSQVTNMSYMFHGATSFNQDLSGWDVSQVTNMGSMFYDATSFNQDLSGWDVSQVVNMSCMFYGATSFNQDLSGWDVSQVVNMSYMFHGATSFNQDLSGWNVVQLRDSENVFDGTMLIATLQRVKSVSSFFEGVYRAMPREERRREFAAVFHWDRRRGFVLFLAGHGYLYSASVVSNCERQATKPSSEVVPCDSIFDVEDLSRSICAFL